MIEPNLIDFFESTIENWNSKQKIIATDLILDKTYRIIKIYDNNKPKLFLKSMQNGSLVDFEKYVKSKCNC